MADKKTQLMAQFYATCQKQGYTDMNDATQSLKAKVIATDMKLNYGNIVVFYDKAKQCHEVILAEQAAAAKEEERRSVEGALLVTLSDMGVFVRPDNTIYTVTAKGEKEEGAPTFEVSKGATVDYTYRPSQAVYTGATNGGITMGGVHYTKAGYEEKIRKTNSGIITVKTKKQEFTLQSAKVSAAMQEAFKRDQQYLSYASKGGYISCTRGNLGNSTASAVLGGGSYHDKMSALSHALDANRMPYDYCVGVVNLLERIVHRQLPPSDETLYKRADSLAESHSSEDILKAAKRFEEISDYRDSAERAVELREKYEVVLQSEKEAAVLKKEANSKRNKRATIILIPILIVCIIAAIFIGRQIKVKQEKAARHAAYQAAVELLESGSYDSAIEAFSELGDYLDSKDQISVAKNAKAAWEKETLYKNAMRNVEQENYSLAMEKFQELGDYKDSQEWINKLEIPVFKESVADKKAGQTVTFGIYEQDNNLENGAEPIEWIVLQSARNDCVIMISKYVLDAQPFHTEKGIITWENCSLRTWLNNDFIATAFTEEELSCLAAIQLSNPDNPRNGTDCGNDTIDFVFTLNAQEASMWVNIVGDETPVTAYAQSKGLRDKSSWMFRTVYEGNETNSVCVAYWSPDFGSTRSSIDQPNGLRPCIVFYVGNQ